MSSLTDQIQEEILDAINNDKITLPTLPEIALQVKEEAACLNVSAASLTKVIGSDAALSARLIKVANSPLLRASNPIEDLKMAVSRLGIDYSANLCTGLAMAQMFQATTEVIDTEMRAIWSNSMEVAGISHILARQYTKLKPDQATLAGLTHKIGALPILTYAEENRKILKDTQLLSKLIDALHPTIGEKILSKWDFPESLLNVPTNYLNFSREIDKPDYADIVLVANLQSLTGSSSPLLDLDWSTIPSFSRLGISHEINSHQAEDLSEDMDAAMSLLA